MAQKATAIIAEQSPLEGVKSRSLARLLLTSMRPHQWTKNLFVLAPLLFGKKLGDPAAVAQALMAAFCFCLIASSLYIFNDIVDAPEDRAHPQKRLRPIPSGALPVWAAFMSSGALLVVALWLAIRLDTRFLLLVAGYWVLMVSYCLALKRAIVLDTMVIALGFVLRVVGGAIAVEVKPTHWLIACTFLLALYLAFTKRRQELLTLSNSAAGHRLVLGKYSIGYLEQVNNILIGATIVCYALYTVAPETVSRFGTDSLIYGTVFVIYGLLRYMALIQDPVNGGDPSRLLLKDKPLLIAIAGWIIYNGAVVYSGFIASLWDRLS
jgi:4-hydroxybenzoate polyprenyltransferase